MLAIDAGGVGVGLRGLRMVHAVDALKLGGGLFVMMQGLGKVFLNVVAVAQIVVNVRDLFGFVGKFQGFLLALLGFAAVASVELIFAKQVECLGKGGGIAVLALDVHGLFEQGVGGGVIAVGGVPCAEIEQALGVLGAGFAVDLLGVVVDVLQLLGELLVLIVLDLAKMALLLGFELAWGHGGGGWAA